MPSHARKYDEFDFQIRPDRNGAYEAAVLRSPAGEVRRTFVLPLGRETLIERLQRLNAVIARRASTGHAASEEIRDFGRLLFDAVFAEGVLQAYDQSLSLASSRGRDLRIRLRVLDDPLLASLPWELLYDPRPGRFVALQTDTLLVRTLETLQPRKELAGEPPLRVLAMAVQPSDLAAIDVESERRHLAAGLARLGDGAVLEWVGGQTWRDLHDALQRGTWHVFHFLGHGMFDEDGGRGYLVFAGETGAAELQPAEEVAQLLGGHDTLRLAVLNACEGAQDGGSRMDVGIAQQLVRAGVPAVVAMQYPISEEHAAELTRCFYGALGNELPIDAALAETRKALSLAAPQDIAWAIPTLVMREDMGPGKETVQASRPHVSRRLALAILAVLITIGAALLIGLPFLAGQIGDVAVAVRATVTPAPTATPTPTATPFVMPGNTFNIAVSKFEAQDKAGKPVDFAGEYEIPAAIRHNIERNAELAQQIGDIFQNPIRVADAESGLPPMGAGAAADLAKQVRADVLVFGTLRQLTENQWEVQPKFYVRDSVFARAPEFLGEVTLGPPLTYRANNRASKADMISAIGDRTGVLAALLVGLTQYDKTDDQAYAGAAQTFERILTESAWAKSTAADGLEIVHYLIGLSYLLRSDLAEQRGDMAEKVKLLAAAKEYFEKGLALNDRSALIYTGLGNAEFELLSGRPTCTTEEAAKLQELERHFNTALRLVDENGQLAPHIRIRAHLYLGRIEGMRERCTQDFVSQTRLNHYLAAANVYTLVQAAERPAFLELAALTHVEIGIVLLEAQVSGLQDSLQVDPTIGADDAAEHFELAVELSAAQENEIADKRAAQLFIPLHLIALCSAQRSGEMPVTLDEDVRRFKDAVNIRAVAAAAYHHNFGLQPKECLDAIDE